MLLKRLKELWCEVMHDSVMWPVGGHYERRLEDVAMISGNGRPAPVTRG